MALQSSVAVYMACADSRSMDPSFQKEATELHGLLKSQSVHTATAKRVEIDLARAKLRSLCSTLKMGETRLLSYAFRRWAPSLQKHTPDGTFC